MIYRLILSFLIVVIGTTGVVRAQGAHYTYPFSVPCPATLTSPGEIVTLKAEFEGGHTGERYLPSYNWTVSSGTIIGGQGTSSITVRTPSREDITDSVTVTLERLFGEAHYPSVQREAACVIHVDRAPLPRLFDKFQTAGNNCEEGFARLDSFLIELNNNPAGQGVIVLYGDLSDTLAQRRREVQLRNQLGFLNFPIDRVTFIRGKPTAQATTQFWLVPPGAENPAVERAAESVLKAPTQPYLYAANYVDGVAGCSGNLYDVAAYARELSSRNGSRGRVVISQSSRAKYYRELNAILRVLRSNGVSRGRVTPVYKYVRPNRTLEVNELWIVPATK